MVVAEAALTLKEKKDDAIGDLLKAERKKKKLSLETVADTLKIRSNYLEALEEGHFDKLPGHTYIYGFLRCYAKHLGLDDDMLVERLKEKGTGAKIPSLESQNRVDREQNRATPTKLLVILALGLLAAAYGGYMLWSDSQEETVADDIIIEAPARAEITIEQSAEPQDIPAPTLLTRLDILAPVFIKIQNPAGEVVEEGMKGEGDTLAVPVEDGWTALFSNAGSVAFFYEDISRGALGAPDSIVTLKPFSVEALRSRVPTPINKP